MHYFSVKGYLNKTFSAQVGGLCSLLLFSFSYINPFNMSENGLLVGKRGRMEGGREGERQEHLVEAVMGR